MPRKPRAAAQAAAKSIKNVPQLPDADGSDDEMVDAPPSEASSPVIEDNDSADENAHAEAEPEPEPEPEPKGDQDGDATPAQPDSPKVEDADAAMSETPATEQTPQVEDAEGAETTSFTGGRQSAIPRKRRLGRPPKNRPPDWDAPDGPDTPLRVNTPKRKRGRPPTGGGRWARNRGPSHLTQVPIDKEGNMMDVINDEVALPPNELGDTKVDKYGNLQGGREYRVRTFTILNRDNRLYMLSTEPARCIGFRDSYLFFQKHKMLYKIIIDDDEKRDLIERDLIPHSYKGRAIGVVTARSVFREFGAKIVVGGKKVIDDYDEQAARERGDVEGDVAVPEDKLPGPGETYNRDKFVAWHGASAVYHTGAPSVPMGPGNPVVASRRRKQVTDDNWQLEHARAASAFNSRLVTMRRAALSGVYDVHTNIMQYPQIMQPTHARFESVPPPDAAGLTADLSSLNIDSAINDHASPEANSAEPPATTIFPPVPASMSDRYVVQDIIYESPQYSNMGIPGPDGDLRNPNQNGLVSIANGHPEFMSPEIIAMLPDDCKEAFIKAAADEAEWKLKWSTEANDGARSLPHKGTAWYP
ncbi:hypothetical protein N7495_001638 [Penicillium taxi]|uniref:uncharacterized protein n=1 Tax=Penicillium taxi TaxID=168475 RepID=UPI0025451799|nr:uncharacterized protein N7495_001638 [Penicillium taxi]KAJ5908956.1 hypothetical protein N7495_001638 [Penicillium taxi]